MKQTTILLLTLALSSSCSTTSQKDKTKIRYRRTKQYMCAQAATLKDTTQTNTAAACNDAQEKK